MRLPFHAALLALVLCYNDDALGQQPGEDSPLLPEVQVEPPSDIPAPTGNYDPGPPETGLYGQTESYPGLSDDLFMGPSGITRDGGSVWDSPQNGSIIDRQELAERQTKDMFNSLQGEVGVLMQRTAAGQSSPYLRGLSGQQVLILIDGIRLNNSTFRRGPNQYFNLIDPGTIEQIEVMRGAQGVLYGSDAIGGAINVQTRSAAYERSLRGEDFDGGGFVEYFTTADRASYTRADFNSWNGNVGVFGGASYMNVRDVDTAGDLGRQEFTNYSQYAADFKYNYLLDQDNLLTISANHFEQQDVPRSDRFGQFITEGGGPSGISPRPTFFDPQQRDLIYARLQGLNLAGIWDSYALTASYHRQREGGEERRNVVSDVRFSENDVQTGGASMVFNHDVGGLGVVSYGTDFYHDDVDGFRNRFNPSNSTTTALDAQYPPDAFYERFGAFLNWELPLTDRLTLNTGVRWEMAHSEGTATEVTNPIDFDLYYDDVIASAALQYELSDEVKLVGGFYEGFRAPNLDDVAGDAYVLQGSDSYLSLEVDPEHSYTYETGVKIDSGRFRSQTYVFYNDFQDQILRQPTPNPNSTNFVRENHDSYVSGVEMNGEYLLDDLWSVYGNFWWTYGKDLEREEPLSRIPPAQGIVGVRRRDPVWRTYLDLYAWMVRHQDRYAYENTIDSRFIVGGTPGYTTLNARWGRTFGDHDEHRLSLIVENITDREYRVLGSGVDGTGFNVGLGYEFRR